MSELLSGVRVLESATLLNGSTVGTVLGDLGADVIKIENPKRGDYIRTTAGQISPDNSPLHIQVNKHKRSVGLDLRQDAGRDVFWRLLSTADVFVDGNIAGSCDKLGIGYAEQQARFPRIVYCQYSGFGSDGPYALMPTHGQMMTALAGATPVFKGEDGLLHRTLGRPVSCSQQRDARSGGEATSAGAVHAALHIVAALLQRERTGEGTFIDVAGVDGVLAHAWVAATISLNEDRITDRTNLAEAEADEITWAKYQYYETSDGKAVLFGAIERKFWNNFCRAAGRDDLAEQHVDSVSAVDFADDGELREVLTEIFLERPSAEWVDLALKHDFPCSPVPNSLVEAAQDPHVQTRGVLVDAPDPDGNPFTYIGEAGKVAGQPYRVQRAAPRLGEHTRELLAEVGIEGDAFESLSQSGVV
ncbi:Formyl-CoA transferase [Mycolicibacterium rhodesiae JS60]|nr:Formyl-CoA transferase [Mycolicibacterium rhodesiae JS60]